MIKLLKKLLHDLRRSKLLFPHLDISKIRYIGSQSIGQDNYGSPVPHWFYARQGIHGCIFWQFELFGSLRRIWIGWKLSPYEIRNHLTDRKYAMKMRRKTPGLPGLEFAVHIFKKVRR